MEITYLTIQKPRPEDEMPGGHCGVVFVTNEEVEGNRDTPMILEALIEERAKGAADFLKRRLLK